MEPEDFIAKYSNAVINACIGTAIFPSVKMAQMALESGWGKKIIVNNAFGIKAYGKLSPFWNGQAYNAKTKENYNGVEVTITDGFRVYKSVQDSISDHTYFLQTNPRYTKAGVFSSKTPEDQAHALEAAGYATDPNYAEKLISIINQYDLKTLDLKKKAGQ